MRSDYMATTQTRNTMAKLGYMGLIPFLFGLLLSLTDSQFLGLSGETLFITYSVVILSFLSGCFEVSAMASNSLSSALWLRS